MGMPRACSVIETGPRTEVISYEDRFGHHKLSPILLQG